MNGMRRIATSFALLLVPVSLAWGAEAAYRMTHRIWLLGGVPEAFVLDGLRSAGVRSLALPVGRITAGGSDAQFTPTPIPSLAALSGWPVTPVVWVEGAGEIGGDASALATQLGPTLGAISGRSGLVLAARQYLPGVGELAAALAKHLGHQVELCVSAQDLSNHLPKGGWPNVLPVAVAGGLPAAVGFPASTLQDDRNAIDRIDGSATRYRLAVVIAPRIEPKPLTSALDLGPLCLGDVATFKTGGWGYVFELRRSLDWGGLRLGAGQSVEVAFPDVASYHRDLGDLMRPVRNGLEGWDTIGLPGPEPVVGISRRALIDYLSGGPASPTPEVAAEWTSATALRLTLVNPTSQGSAIGTTGTWVELWFAGSEVRDLQLGQFTGTEYGRYVGGQWRRTAAGGASVVRLYLVYLPPNTRVSGGVVDFLTRPREVSARWVVRTGDGHDIYGPISQVLTTTR